MRIAFASYEYPGETGGGGIGTYLQTVAQWLVQQGHGVVVFTGTREPKAFWENDFVFRLPALDWKSFDEILPNFFLTEHQKQPFDVLECTDFRACGLSLKKALPELPTVVRLHTPLFLVDRLLHRPLSFIKKLRFILGSLKQMKRPSLPKAPQAQDYAEEFELVELGEIISSPSQSITEELEALGFQLSDKTCLVPLPFDATPFKFITSRKDLNSAPQIVFIGRMETRKGVIDLADAIPGVLRLFPASHFTFVGESSNSPDNGVDMVGYLKRKLQTVEAIVNFTGKISREDVMKYIAGGDIFVFPSHYESFGLVCCEAMAAGKAVIGSKRGGMSEIIEDRKSGLLIEPNNPDAIAKAIETLVRDNDMRLQLGIAARQRIVEYLSPQEIIKKQLACYQNAINKRNPGFSLQRPVNDVAE